MELTGGAKVVSIEVKDKNLVYQNPLPSKRNR